MKKPNQFYKKLGGKRSKLGVAMATAFHPVRSLRAAFGYDKAANDAAQAYNLGPCLHAYQLVMATIRSWGKTYRGPKLSFLFSLTTPRQTRVVDARQPRPD